MFITHDIFFYFGLIPVLLCHLFIYSKTLLLYYKCIFIFLGMTESIVAAAASRIGKRVLHLDW